MAILFFHPQNESNQRSLNSFWYIYLKKSIRDQMVLRDHEYGPPMDRLCCWIALFILFGCSLAKAALLLNWALAVIDHAGHLKQ